MFPSIVILITSAVLHSSRSESRRFVWVPFLPLFANPQITPPKKSRVCLAYVFNFLRSSQIKVLKQGIFLCLNRNFLTAFKSSCPEHWSWVPVTFPIRQSSKADVFFDFRFLFTSRFTSLSSGGLPVFFSLRSWSSSPLLVIPSWKSRVCLSCLRNSSLRSPFFSPPSRHFALACLVFSLGPLHRTPQSRLNTITQSVVEINIGLRYLFWCCRNGFVVEMMIVCPLALSPLLL